MRTLHAALVAASLASPTLTAPAQAAQIPEDPAFRDGAYYEDFANMPCSETSCRLELAPLPGGKSLQLSRIACLVVSTRRVVLASVAKAQSPSAPVEPAALQLPTAVIANNLLGNPIYYYTINQEVSYRIPRNQTANVLVTISQNATTSVRCHVSGKLVS